MSKKKGKAAAKKAPKKQGGERSTAAAAARLAATGGRRRRHDRRRSRSSSSGPAGQQDPDRATAAPTRVPVSIEWTVVNLVDGTDVPVTLTWPQRRPVGQGADRIRSSNRRESPSGVKPGDYQVRRHALDAQEDPEIEFPQN